MLAAVSLALLAAPASGQAAVTLGTVANAPNGATTEQSCPAGCTFVPVSYVSGALVSSPFDGVITKWRVFADNYTYTARLRVIGHPNAGTYIPKRTGVTHNNVFGNLSASAFTNDPPLRIDAGEIIGVTLTGASGKVVVERSGLGSFDGSTGITWTDGNTYGPPANQPNWELELEATVEPDADHDGFGDETQDLCPTNASTQAACPPAAPGSPGSGGLGLGAGLDVTPPAFTGKPRANPKSFVVDPKGTAEQPVSAAKKGTTLEFTLSEPATVTFLVERQLAGRLVKGKCKAQTRANRDAKRCKRYKRAGAFRAAGVAGANRKPFSGRIGKKSLTPGPYRVTLSATDAAGNRSKPQTLSLQVARPSKQKR